MIRHLSVEEGALRSPVRPVHRCCASKIRSERAWQLCRDNVLRHRCVTQDSSQASIVRETAICNGSSTKVIPSCRNWSLLLRELSYDPIQSVHNTISLTSRQ